MSRSVRAVPLLIAAVIALVGATAPAPSLSAAPPGLGSTAQAPAAVAVVGIGVTVSDLDRSVAFYTSVLDFELLSEREEAGEPLERISGVFAARCRTARLRLGDEFVELTEFLAPEGRSLPPDSRSNDGWFQHIAIVVADMDRAYARLREHGVRHISPGPQTLPEWNPNAGGISAFYFRDPDGHALELIRFPEGKGDPKWRRPTDRLFLGIDHTAIAVADTDRALAFYAGELGMRIAGASENYGPEQERLNSVFGARLRITALRAERGPGVELLEYLAPGPGRPYPADAAASDLVHWRTIIDARDAAAVDRIASSAHARWISPGALDVAASYGAEGRAVHLRDPDGHAVLLTEHPAP